MKFFSCTHWSRALAASVNLLSMRGINVLSMKLIIMFANCLIELLMLLTIQSSNQALLFSFQSTASKILHLFCKFGDSFLDNNQTVSMKYITDFDFITLIKNILKQIEFSNQIMEVVRKYHRISAGNSQTQAANLINTLIDESHLKYFSRNVMSFYKEGMAKQIVTAQSQSIEQTRSGNPNPPSQSVEDQKPQRRTFDTFRPYSAKVERIRRQQIISPKQHTFSKRLPSAKGLHTTKSIKSINNITPLMSRNRQQKSEFKKQKYKSRLIPLANNYQEDEQCDKMIEKLRKNKLKAEEYEKGKQNFLSSVAKENDEYQKRKIKFISTMPRKQYTYTYNCQVVEILKAKESTRRLTSTRPEINISAKKNQEEEKQKPQQIYVEFAKKQTRAELKDYLFVNTTDVKPQSICPQSTAATKFAVIIQDC